MAAGISWLAATFLSAPYSHCHPLCASVCEIHLALSYKNTYSCKIHIIGVPEGEEREEEAESIIEEIVAENFPNLGKERDIQVQEEQKVPNKLNLKRLHQDIL